MSRHHSHVHRERPPPQAAYTETLARRSRRELHADFTQTGPSVAVAQLVLANLAPTFGFDPGDTARYTTRYRNPALAHLSAERIYIVYTAGGLDAVRAERHRLRARGII